MHIREVVGAALIVTAVVLFFIWRSHAIAVPT